MVPLLVFSVNGIPTRDHFADSSQLTKEISPEFIVGASLGVEHTDHRDTVRGHDCSTVPNSPTLLIGYSSRKLHPQAIKISFKLRQAIANLTH